jgi:hypothetical protein
MDRPIIFFLAKGICSFSELRILKKKERCHSEIVLAFFVLGIGENSEKALLFPVE